MVPFTATTTGSPMTLAAAGSGETEADWGEVLIVVHGVTDAIAFPRQIAMYLARTLTECSTTEIGDAFGGRDHGTVIHACKAVDNMMDQDATMRGSVGFLKAQLSK